MRSCPGAQALDGWVSRLVNRQCVDMPCVVTYESLCVCVCLGEERGGGRSQDYRYLAIHLCML